MDSVSALQLWLLECKYLIKDLVLRVYATCIRANTDRSTYALRVQ